MEITNIKMAKHIIALPHIFSHTLLPTINSTNAQLHTINCGHDESLPYVNLYTSSRRNLANLFKHLAPPTMTTVVDFRCFLGSTEGLDVEEVCEMMPQLKRLLPVPRLIFWRSADKDILSWGLSQCWVCRSSHLSTRT